MSKSWLRQSASFPGKPLPALCCPHTFQLGTGFCDLGGVFENGPLHFTQSRVYVLIHWVPLGSDCISIEHWFLRKLHVPGQPGWEGKSALPHSPLCRAFSSFLVFAVIVMNVQIYFWWKRPRKDVCQQCGVGEYQLCPGLLTEWLAVVKNVCPHRRAISMLFLNPWTHRLWGCSGVQGGALTSRWAQSQCQCKGHKLLSRSRYVKVWVLRQEDCKFRGGPVSMMWHSACLACA